MQDTSGFPPFHEWAPPPGPAVVGTGSFSAPVLLSETPGGGYRPQVAIGSDGTLHVLYYERLTAGDLIQHRRSTDGQGWTEPARVGLDHGRNWGPDLVARSDGSVVAVFDHARPDFSGLGYLSRWSEQGWSPPEALTDDDGGEVGSGHIAHGPGDELVFVWIGKPRSPQHRFVAYWRWFQDGRWTEASAFTDGSADAWHTNVERRPDGTVLAGWDVGQGGSATRLFLADGRDGRFAQPEELSTSGPAGERPHFAFGTDGVDHITWFRKESGRPVAVYVRSGRPGSWGETVEPSAGLGGFHFDPDIAVDGKGRRVLVWGWDSGGEAELVYAVDTGQGWSTPLKVAEIGWGKPGLPSIDVGPDGVFHVVWNQGVRGDNKVYAARLVLP